MNALSVVFPESQHLLCIWHKAKNVLAKTKTEFGARENCEFEAFLNAWAMVCRASTTEEFDERMEELEEFSGPAAVAYVKATWLPYKERFVRAWVDRHLHLGQTATSRVEGNHAMLKKRIQTSTKNLLATFKCIDRAVRNQVVEMKVCAARSGARVLHATSDPILSIIRSGVSKFACIQIAKQLRIADDDADLGRECTGVHLRTLGLPCSHELRRIRSRGDSLQVDDIHPQWHLHASEDNEADVSNNLRSSLEGIFHEVSSLPSSQQMRALDLLRSIVHGPQEPYVRDPDIVQTRGRRAGSRQPLSSTHRDPSLFEVVAGPSRQVYRCSMCGEQGHNARRCRSRHYAVPSDEETQQAELA